jgi:hypothetical protein
MKIPLPSLATLLCALALPAFAADAPAAADGFTPLFDGKTLSGWHNPYTWGKPEAVDGEIHLTADKKFFLLTEKSFRDFVFEGEVLLPKGTANSGFLFRTQIKDDPKTKGKQAYGYQAEVDGDAGRNWSGGLYDEGRRMWFVSPIKGNAESIAAFKMRAGDTFKRDEWNAYRITCKGSHIKIEVNGVVTSEFDDSMDAAGPIGIQHHGEKGQTYKFRNLRIKEL